MEFLDKYKKSRNKTGMHVKTQLWIHFDSLSQYIIKRGNSVLGYLIFKIIEKKFEQLVFLFRDDLK